MWHYHSKQVQSTLHTSFYPFFSYIFSYSSISIVFFLSFPKLNFFSFLTLSRYSWLIFIFFISVFILTYVNIELFFMIEISFCSDGCVASYQGLSFYWMFGVGSWSLGLDQPMFISLFVTFLRFRRSKFITVGKEYLNFLSK